MNLPLSGKITAYEIKDDKSVTQLQSVTLYSAADNLHLSQSGDVLYTGAHPILYKAYQYFQDPRQYAPSSVSYLYLYYHLFVSFVVLQLKKPKSKDKEVF